MCSDGYTFNKLVGTSEQDIVLTLGSEPDDSECLILNFSRSDDQDQPLAKNNYLEIYFDLNQCVELKTQLDKHIRQAKRERRKVVVKPRLKP